MAEYTNYHAPYVAAWRHLLFERAKWDPQQPRTVVEVGSYEGSSACWLMTELLRAPESRLYCIDVWTGEDGEALFQKFQANIAELPNAAQVETLRDWSQNALRELIRRKVKADLPPCCATSSPASTW